MVLKTAQAIKENATPLEWNYLNAAYTKFPEHVPRPYIFDNGTITMEWIERTSPTTVDDIIKAQKLLWSIGVYHGNLNKDTVMIQNGNFYITSFDRVEEITNRKDDVGRVFGSLQEQLEHGDRDAFYYLNMINEYYDNEFIDIGSISGELVNLEQTNEGN
jgi:hypothetical protein